MCLALEREPCYCVYVLALELEPCYCVYVLALEREPCYCVQYVVISCVHEIVQINCAVLDN